jgi:hypothetical protein
MFRMRRWWLVGGLLLAQTGIVLVFLQLQTAGPSEASAAQAPVDGPPNTCPVAPAAPAPPLPEASPPAVPVWSTPSAPKADTAPLPEPAKPADASPTGEIHLLPLGPSSAIQPVTAVPTAPAPPPVVCPWTLHLVVVEGRTVLTAKIGDEVQFKVTCDKLDLQAPGGAIQAAGAIKLTSAGLDGSAERLTINLHEDRVILDGQAHLKARRQSQELELQAERLSLRIMDGRLGDSAEAAEPPARQHRRRPKP